MCRRTTSEPLGQCTYAMKVVLKGTNDCLVTQSLVVVLKGVKVAVKVKKSLYKSSEPPFCRLATPSLPRIVRVTARVNVDIHMTDVH